jgi:enterochelin esterase-like enzyme
MIGGVSRGGGWAWDIFMDYPQLFGTVAGHSPALFQRIPSLLVHRLEGLLQGQRLWLDVGEQDPELNYLTSVHEAMDASGIKHEFHVYQGTHTEEYWKTNLSEYLLWYLAGYSPP